MGGLFPSIMVSSLYQVGKWDLRWVKEKGSASTPEVLAFYLRRESLSICLRWAGELRVVGCGVWGWEVGVGAGGYLVNGVP